MWVSLSNLRTKPFTFFSLGLEALPALGGYTMDPNGAPAEGYGTALQVPNSMYVIINKATWLL